MPGGLTTNEFIERAVKIHGNKYDYSLVEYVNSRTKVKIICREHGIFEQLPKNHINNKQRCPSCVGGVLLQQGDFISKAKSVHGNRYDYSLVDYVNTKTKVKIICKAHGVFEQMPFSHNNGIGCPKCGGTQKLTTEEFIQKAKTIHDDKYDYSLVEYVNTKTKVKIICKNHGVFEQIPYTHLNKHGCPICRYIQSAKKKTLDISNFLKRAKDIHGDRYDYSLVEYKKAHKKVKIICKEHGVFHQIPNLHWAGIGCPKCGGTQKLTTEEFIENARSVHGDAYDYSLVEYNNSRTKVKIICNDHGVFEQSPNGHLNGRGCPKCINTISKPELELQEFVSLIYNEEITTNSRQIIKPYELDIYLPDLKLAFEFNGEYWHSTEDAKRRDGETKRLCKENNIQLMIIWERYWNRDKDKIKLAIKQIINRTKYKEEGIVL